MNLEGIREEEVDFKTETEHTRVNLEGYTKMRGVGGLLNLCQGGTCICDHQQNTVLYCYGEVRLDFWRIYSYLTLPSGGVEEASSARRWRHLAVYSGAPLPRPAGPVGHRHPAAPLHALHPPLHPVHPLLPQESGQEDLSAPIRRSFITCQPSWNDGPRKGLTFRNMLENLHSSLHFPGCSPHWKRTSGERDVCRREGAGSSFRYVVHPWVRHDMRNFLETLLLGCCK